MLSRLIRSPLKIASCVARGFGLSETGPAEAQAPIPVGGEFQVNLYAPFGRRARYAFALRRRG